MNNQTNCPKGIARPAGSGRPTRCGRLNNLQTGNQRFKASHASFPNANQALTLSATAKKKCHRIDGDNATAESTRLNNLQTENQRSNPKFIPSPREAWGKVSPGCEAATWRRMGGSRRTAAAKLEFIQDFSKSSFRGIAGNFSSWEIKKSSLPSGRASAPSGGLRRRAATVAKPLANAATVTVLILRQSRTFHVGSRAKAASGPG